MEPMKLVNKIWGASRVLATPEHLFKVITTIDNLSIQVHPGEESWYILDAEPGAGVYLDLQTGVSKQELIAAVNQGDAVDQLLKFYPVKKNDFFSVPKGMIHAIGKGISLFEIQEKPNKTYRLWDWNRNDLSGTPRKLHIKEALNLIEER